MNFDLSWFLTIPGMLITGGVLLLLIALIIFIATNGKAKKKKEEIAEEAPLTTNDMSAMTGMVPPVTVDPNMGYDPMMGVDPVAPVVPEMGPVMEPVLETPEMAPIQEPMMAPVEPVYTPEVPATPMMPESQPVVQEPVVAPTPVMEPVAPIIEPVIQMETPAVEEAPKVSIYGGVSPVIPDMKEELNAPHAIYGGANPLDATQSIPIQTPVTPEVTVVQENNDVVDHLANFEPTPSAEDAFKVEPAAPIKVETPVVETVAPIVEDEVEVLDF